MKWVFANGPVFVGDTQRRWATAVGVIDGRIVAVGTDDDVRAVIGDGAEFVDLDDRFLIAGFQDAHVHPAMGGMTRMRCNLEDVTDVPSALSKIRDYVASHPDDAWIRGGGWNYGWFPGGNPPAALLDDITGQPVCLEGADGHSSWVNSAALRLAGITADTPDPDDGRIERLADGSPQGTLHEGAMRLVDHVLPPPTASEVRAGLIEGQRFLFSKGITGWQDAWVEHGVHAAYRQMAADGTLRASVRGCLWWDRERGIEQLDEHIEASREGEGRYDPRTIKLMLDGVCENHTAALLGPYFDGQGEETVNSGLDFIDPGELGAIVTAIDAAGLQCHFHALGDRAVRNALDAIEQARIANGWNDLRPHLAHLQIVDPADVPRFRRLGATANAQPLWAVAEEAMTELTIPFLGPTRSALQYPWRDLLAAGATMAMGSDWSVSTPDVMAQVAVAVHRSAPDVDEPFLPHQRISVTDALVGFTAGSAYVNHRDNESGSIEVGKHADLAVLDANPFEVEWQGDIAVDLTMIGGEVVYEGGVS